MESDTHEPIVQITQVGLKLYGIVGNEELDASVVEGIKSVWCVCPYVSKHSHG